MGLEYITQPQVFLGGLTALGPGIEGLTENYPLLTTYYSWTSTASVNTSSFPIPIDVGSIYNGPNNSGSFIVSVGGVVQSPTEYTVDPILRTITFSSIVSAGIEFAATQLATAAPSSQSFNYIESVSAEFFNISVKNSTGEVLVRTKDTSNIFIGDSTTGRDATTGNHNFVFGLSAGRSNTTGSFNNFFGYKAGGYNTTGSHNNFLGDWAGLRNTTGFSNNFLGDCAGLNNTTGSSNNFFGYRAGLLNTTGFSNNFLGSCAGGRNTTGSYNNFFGCLAGRNNTTGSSNNFLGRCAGFYNTTGFSNNFLGSYAGGRNTTGYSNNFLGGSAGRNNTTGSYNNFLGCCAGLCNSTGCSNNFLGLGAGRSNTTGNFNNFLGRLAGLWNTTGSNNNFLGSGAGFCNTTGYYNNFFGCLAGRYNTTGSSNNFLGDWAGLCNTTGSSNNFFGFGTGRLNTTGGNNNFLGSGAGCCNSTGSYNNFLGDNSGRSNTTGCSNNFLGRCAGLLNTAGSSNNFIGFCAGFSNTCGTYNNIFGHRANVATNSLSGVIVLGTNAIATESHQVVLSTANVLFRNTDNTFNIGGPGLQNNLTVNGNISASGDLFSNDSLLSYGAANTTLASPGRIFYGDNSDIVLDANSRYELIFELYFAKTTATTAIYAISGTTTFTNVAANYTQHPAAGIQANAATTGGGVVAQTAALITFPATASLTTGVNHHAVIKATVETGDAVRVNLTAWNGAAGTITPLRGSYWVKRRII